MPDTESLVIRGAIFAAGFGANLSVLALLSHQKFGSELTKRLMTSQLIVDGVITIFSLGLLFYPVITPNFGPEVAFVACYVIRSGTMYNYFQAVSVYNLMWIAVDRFLAVGRPSTYRSSQRKMIIVAYATMFLLPFVCSAPAPYLVIYADGKCRIRMLYDRSVFAAVYTAFTFYVGVIFAYLVPGITMLVCQAKMVLALREVMRPQKREMAQSNASSSDRPHPNSFNRTVAIPALIMCINFLISAGYKHVYYLLGAHKIISYDFASFAGRMALILNAIGSSVNPLVIVWSSGSFRRQIRVCLNRLNVRMNASLFVPLTKLHCLPAHPSLLGGSYQAHHSFSTGGFQFLIGNNNVAEASESTAYSSQLTQYEENVS
ncbi:unnamed protein product [Calicophoron daubneyi]|uniref:G-protein coupled receptors family 1 profile domain-containing protein n=1 Tax=Calicophoron daubneyi TaxID=300641 RepID=A0AAV2TV26_CALDB